MTNVRKFSRGRSETSAKPRIEIYFKTWCPYSRKALALLSEKGVPYSAIDVTSDRVLEAEMIDRSGRTSVPQIFIDGEGIGGYDDLRALVALGAFDLLNERAKDLPQAA